jgi:uncharacterized protein with HEPN domain
LLQNAVLHWIEIIGKAARGVSDKVRDAHPEVPWRVITDMRNRVTHVYFDIDLDIVWNMVTRDLPKLREFNESEIREAEPGVVARGMPPPRCVLIRRTQRR